MQRPEITQLHRAVRRGHDCRRFHQLLRRQLFALGLLGYGAVNRLLGARWPATFPPRLQRLPTMKPGEFLTTTNEI